MFLIAGMLVGGAWTAYKQESKVWTFMAAVIALAGTVTGSVRMNGEMQELAKHSKNQNNNRVPAPVHASTAAAQLGPDPTQPPALVSLWKVPGCAPTMVAVAAPFGAWSN